jgi:hypothetical protein
MRVMMAPIVRISVFGGVREAYGRKKEKEKEPDQATRLGETWKYDSRNGKMGKYWFLSSAAHMTCKEEE